MDEEARQKAKLDKQSKRGIRRVSTLMTNHGSIPGNYEEFSYLEAKKVEREIVQMQTFVQ